MNPVMSPIALGKELRRYRKLQQLTQEQVGNKFKIPQKTISNIENGKPGVELNTLFKVMAALGLYINVVPRDGASNEDIW